MRIAFIMVLASAFFIQADAQHSPPTILKDKHMCAGEGCSNKGRIKILKSVIVRSTPSEQSSRKFTLARGTSAVSIDGEVHTRAGRFVVSKKHEQFKPGDVIYVYTYLGEGFFKVWFKGKWSELDLSFSPWGGSSGNRCQDDEKHCFGVLEREADMKSWIKLRDKRGRTGWVLLDLSVMGESNVEWLDLIY